MGNSNKHEKKSKKKHKHKERKEKKKKSKKLKKHSKEKKDKDKKVDEEQKLSTVTTNKQTVEDNDGVDDDDDDFAIPLELMNSKSHAPETPEEYQQRQNRLRREIDPVTGRSRLIKGDGEVLEEIVSKERHKAINKDATKGDGDFFQENTLGKSY